MSACFALSACCSGRGATGVYVKKIMAYIADGDAGLTVINISEPASPSLADSIETPKSIYDVYASGDYAYLGDGQSGCFLIQGLNINVA